MIELHRLDDTKILINSDLIESVEEIPDTVITLTNGNKYIVREKIAQILGEIVKFKQRIQVKQIKKTNGLQNKGKSAD
ncbi:MAG: flagellar FlbD family protein [Actinomycetota bacterium]|nr:flagellar FlbD family protein [Actinomycetota bacterium]